MTYQLGIDVGTTYTAAAVCRSSGRGWSEPEIVTLGTRGATVPSVLYVAVDGSVVVGEAAERRAVTDPDRVVREFKRRIGDRTPIVVAGRSWAPEELSARLVRWVVDRVAEREGGPAAGTAISHPASWGAHKKELFAGALAGQGLTVMFLAEPQAAALSYAASERVGPGSTIAVYDLGGGTFDAAVVHKSDAAGPAGFGLLGRPEGLERLGGIDFDQVVFDHVLSGLPDAFANLDDTDPAVLSAVARIRRECTEAKEALSSDTEVSIPVLLPASRGSVRLHRSEFEGQIRPQIEETVTALRRAVASAGLTPEQLTAVLLVGGSSRIPLVGQLVSEQLGRPVAVDADPKNAIAKGAALAIAPRPAAAPGPSRGTSQGSAIPPIVGAAGLGAAAGAAAGSALPSPPRPPRSSLPPQQQGQPQQSWQPPPAQRGPDRPPAPMPPRPRQERISHESANGLYSASDDSPRGGRPAAYAEPEWDQDDYDDRDLHSRRGGGRPTGLLIGIGGVLAAAALVVGVLVWTSYRAANTSTATPGDGGAATTSAEPAPEPTRAPVSEAPAPTVPTRTPTKPTTTKPAPTTTEPPTPTTTVVPNPGGGVGVNPGGTDPVAPVAPGGGAAGTGPTSANKPTPPVAAVPTSGGTAANSGTPVSTRRATAEASPDREV